MEAFRFFDFRAVDAPTGLFICFYPNISIPNNVGYFQPFIVKKIFGFNFSVCETQCTFSSRPIGNVVQQEEVARIRSRREPLRDYCWEHTPLRWFITHSSNCDCDCCEKRFGFRAVHFLGP